MHLTAIAGPKWVDLWPVRSRFGHLRDFSDSFVTEFSEVRRYGRSHSSATLTVLRASTEPKAIGGCCSCRSLQLREENALCSRTHCRLVHPVAEDVLGYRQAQLDAANVLCEVGLIVVVHCEGVEHPVHA